MKTQTKDLKILIWLILFTALIGFYAKHNVIKPAEANAPNDAINYRLPFNDDKEMTDKDIIYAVAMRECYAHGYGKLCRNDLMGIANKESKFDCTANGDFGASHGCFQIHLGYHPEITQEEARDPEFATKWTFKRLLHYGYPEYRSYAIMRHNGTPGTEKTLSYLEAVNNY
ncbi:MAG: hypothetical protein C4519_24265 [Desulfobacteraceae bacterium]|nr:MAG: hypothetical protein C4519_24265 [Desulfobacteraceae bacterium]